MELQLYLDMVKRRALVIAIVAAVAVLVVAVAGLLIPPVYTASATVRVLLDPGVADFRLYEDSSKRLLNTYTQILESAPILDQAISQLAPRTASLKAGVLRPRVKVEVVLNTELISISVQDQDPVLARDLANTLSKLLTEYAQDLYAGDSKSTRQILEEQLASVDNDLNEDRQRQAALLAMGNTGTEVEALARQIKFKEDAYDRLLTRYELARLNESLRANSITVISPATSPRLPSNSLGLTQIGLSLVVGLFSGLGLALVLENIDTRIHSPQQLEHLTNLRVLATLPKGLFSPDSLGHHNGDDQADSSGPIEEAYRLLSLNLLALKEDAPLRTILITSAVPREGKSMVAANLAQSLAGRGQTVFLVESDLRRPTLDKIFGLDPGLGLSTLLVERAPISDTALGRVMQPAELPSLFLIGSGPRVPNPTALLASISMEKILSYLGAQGQITLLDAPPVLGMADVSVLTPKVDGVIVVVREGFTKREQLQAAMKQLEASRARVLGHVFLREHVRGWGYD